MKKIISLLTLCAVLVFPASAFASEDNNSNLTKEEIRIQYDQIMEKYQVNEPFSDEDAAFIFEYADELGAQKLNDESTITPFASERKSFQGANGTRNITGFITYDNTLVTNSWRLYMTAWDTTQIKRDIVTGKHRDWETS